MWDNNKVKQVLKLNLNKIVSTKQRNFRSSKTFHNNQSTHNIQILNCRTTSKDQRPCFSNIHPNHNIMEQEIEQQEGSRESTTNKYTISKIVYTSPEHKLATINSCTRSIYKNVSTLPTIDNINTKHRINLRRNKIESQRTISSTYRKK